MGDEVKPWLNEWEKPNKCRPIVVFLIWLWWTNYVILTMLYSNFLFLSADIKDNFRPIYCLGWFNSLALCVIAIIVTKYQPN